jgi:hypothetical protein
MLVAVSLLVPAYEAVWTLPLSLVLAVSVLVVLVLSLSPASLRASTTVVVAVPPVVL